jgi:hypothetical protein
MSDLSELDKSFIGKFAEVITKVGMETSDGGKVVIDMSAGGLGNIEVFPWRSEGEFSDTYEDRVIFSPCNLNDVLILECMAEHARRVKTIVDAELAERQPEAKPVQPAIVANGSHALNDFALR